MLFTQSGRCYWLRVYEIPEGDRSARGRAIQNLISIESEDTIKAYLTVSQLDDEDFVNSHYIIMATRRGTVKKTLLEEYSRPRATGIIAISINEGDELIDAKLTNGKSQVVLAARSGYAVRFDEADVRDMGRSAAGVRGITLQDEQDAVVGMVVVNTEQAKLLVVSENGYGKQSPLGDYRLTARGAKGVKTIQISDKTGALIAIKQVEDAQDEDLMIMTRNGIAIRIRMRDISVLGRNTQGVRLIKLRENDGIASVAHVQEQEEEGETGTENGTEIPA
jgi:DNA gyrase subunit A